MKKINFHFVALLTVLLLPTYTSAQTEATTADGKIVLLKSDGTWTYKNDSTSSASPSASALITGDCSAFISVQEDRLTGEKTTTSPKDVIIVSKDGKDGLSMYWMLIPRRSGGSVLVLALKAYGAGCIDDASKVNILFRDGTKLTLVHGSKFNCDGDATLYFGSLYGKKKELDLLCTKEIEVMRVWGRDTYIEEVFSEEQSMNLMNSGNCIRGLM